MVHTLLQIINERSSLGIESCNSDFAFEDIRPLGFFVPMQLSDYAFLETHVDACEFFAGW